VTQEHDVVGRGCVCIFNIVSAKSFNFGEQNMKMFLLIIVSNCYTSFIFYFSFNSIPMSYFLGKDAGAVGGD
jgi:hypothetical protein